MASNNSHMSMLPQDCISRILSLTSPKDACTMLAVSKEFRNPAESDVVWAEFLPSDCDIAAVLSTSKLKFSSKKQIFFLLSHYILIDAGYKAFALEKSRGGKCYILSARELSIWHSHMEANWKWKSDQQSRFPQVAELKSVERLEIQGKIRSPTLSPNTNYAAYLIFKICDPAFGLDSIPCELSITSNGTVLNTNTATLCDPDDKKRNLQRLFYGNRVQKMKERLINKDDERMVGRREDGWLEIEVGEFIVGDRDDEIAVRVMEVKGHQLKGGLILEGIEIRPKL